MKTAPERGQGQRKTFEAGKSNCSRRRRHSVLLAPGALQWFMPWKLFLKCGFRLARREPIPRSLLHGCWPKVKKGTPNDECRTTNTKLSKVYKLAWHELLMIPAVKWTTAAPRQPKDSPTNWLTDWLANWLSVLDVGTNVCHLPEKKLGLTRSPAPKWVGVGLIVDNFYAQISQRVRTTAVDLVCGLRY